MIVSVSFCSHREFELVSEHGGQRLLVALNISYLLRFLNVLTPSIPHHNNEVEFELNSHGFFCRPKTQFG